MGMQFYTKHRKMKFSICLWVLVIFLVLSVESQAGGKKGNKQKSGRNKNARKGKGKNEKGIEFTPCNGATVGHCACTQGDPKVRTYSFDMDGQQRCFTVDHPRNGAEALPVLLTASCYTSDNYTQWSRSNSYAKRYGYSQIYLSQPQKDSKPRSSAKWTPGPDQPWNWWNFGNDNVANDQVPMSCSDKDSKDLAYVRKVIEFIDSNPTMFNNEKIYIQGHSQNSMFASYIGYCLNERIVGIWSGASGLLLPKVDPPTPGCQGHTKMSDYKTCVIKDKIGCEQCINEGHGCKECKYWPIYPCYSNKRPQVHCLSEYGNDPVAPPNAAHMYDAATAEGHDPRQLTFSPPEDGSIAGGHQPPRNVAYWTVGCLGITKPCTSQCEKSFTACMGELQPPKDAKTRTFNWQKCLKRTNLAGCQMDCAPTYDMLKLSEEPTTARFSNFGAGSGVKTKRPASSKCLKSGDDVIVG